MGDTVGLNETFFICNILGLGAFLVTILLNRSK